MRAESFQQKLGSRFTILATVIVIVMMTYYFDRYLDKQNNPNQQVTTIHSEQASEVTLTRNRFGHYVVSAIINDQEVTAMLDTGATHVSIPAEIANELQLKHGPSFEVSTANGTIIVYATILDNVQIGDIKLENVRANINPFMQEKEVLLGMSFLKQLEFTQKGSQLTLKQHKGRLRK